MKTPYVAGLVIAAVLVTVAIEETRMSSLRQSAAVTAADETPSRPSAASAPSADAAAPPVRTKSRPAGAEPARPGSDESFAGTARKMWDNPAGKSMMNQGAKMAVAMMYQEFIDGLTLSKEETDYFKNLLGKEISDQQELAMKMLGASPEERDAMAKEMKKRGEENAEEIKKFLNNDADVKAFDGYKNHLPERQQLDGIRSAMAAKGSPLDTATETKLVDAMYRARTGSSAPDLSGPAGIEALKAGNLIETFSQSWDTQQEKLAADSASFLSETQRTALRDYQKQAKEMQLMSLKMAEKMMPGKGDGAR